MNFVINSQLQNWRRPFGISNSKDKMELRYVPLIFMGQPDNKLIGKIVEIKSDTKVDLSKFRINLSEGFGWNTNLYTIFDNGKIIELHFPTKAGDYNLVINYADKLVYTEMFIYRSDPKHEKLNFEFYKEGKRIFCKINSIQASELNKEIVLNKLSDELNGIIKSLGEDGKK